MICNNTKCTREIPEDAVFCPYCGRKQLRPKRKTKSRGNGLGSVYKKGDRWIAVKTLSWSVDPLPPDAPPGAQTIELLAKQSNMLYRTCDG